MSTNNLRSTYDKIADDYHKDHLGDSWDDDHIAAFIKMIPDNGKVLELGCGPGVDVGKLLKGGLTKIYGFDLSDKLLDIARKDYSNCEFIQGDMRQLPYEENFFDGVFSKAVLLHIAKRNIDQVLSEITRVLKPGGSIHIAIKKGEGEKEIEENDYGYSYSRLFSYWETNKFQQVLINHGIKIIRIDELPVPEKQQTWIKILAKKSSKV